MKPGRIAAWAITAVAVPGLAACSGSSPGGTGPTTGSSQPAAGRAKGTYHEPQKGTGSAVASKLGAVAGNRPATTRPKPKARPKPKTRPKLGGIVSRMDFAVEPVTSAQWPALEDLFGRSGASNGCWCMYWRIGPRYRDRPRADNREDLRRLAASGRPPGLLAFDGDRAAGWCELAPRAELGWLAQARYLGPVDDLPVWSVPCFYVRSSHRGRGVMDALIEAALPAAASAGAPALEAYPVDTTVPSHTGNVFPGIAAVFARHGFQVVARRKPDRPVMRRAFGPA
jgi:GNAT superfamily N-acetyltransferase